MRRPSFEIGRKVGGEIQLIVVSVGEILFVDEKIVVSEKLRG